jgi:hypothetical protein
MLVAHKPVYAANVQVAVCPATLGAISEIIRFWKFNYLSHGSPFKGV